MHVFYVRNPILTLPRLENIKNDEFSMFEFSIFSKMAQTRRRGGLFWSYWYGFQSFFEPELSGSTPGPPRARILLKTWFFAEGRSRIKSA